MNPTVIIGIAASILVVVVALLVREVARSRRQRTAGEEELTRFAKRPGIPLPRLDQIAAADEKTEADAVDSISESKPLTVFESETAPEEASAPHDLVFLSAAGHTDRGKRRRRNEDAYFTSEDRGLYVVADGMGGYAGGDVASRIAVESVARAFEDEPPASVADPVRPTRANELVSAIERANKVIRQAQDADHADMGTTLIAAKFAKRRGRVYVGHVGDSRCYRLRNGELKLLTCDHTLAAKGVGGPMGGNLRRALGMGDRVKVDVVVDRPRSGDRYMLCTDGLSKMIDHAAVERLLASGSDSSPQEIVTDLIAAANAAGGTDNVTVVVVAVWENVVSPASQVDRA